MKVMVIDGQGGGLGRQLVAAIKARLPQVTVLAVGTNSAATTAMLRAGADQAATGENAVVVGSRSADAIVGPVGADPRQPVRQYRGGGPGPAHGKAGAKRRGRAGTAGRLPAAVSISRKAGG